MPERVVGKHTQRTHTLYLYIPNQCFERKAAETWCHNLTVLAVESSGWRIVGNKHFCIYLVGFHFKIALINPWGFSFITKHSQTDF